MNILTPTTFFHGEPGYLIFCTVAVPKLDSVVGEEARLKLLLANCAARCCLINYAIGPSTLYVYSSYLMSTWCVFCIHSR